MRACVRAHAVPVLICHLLAAVGGRQGRGGWQPVPILAMSAQEYSRAFTTFDNFGNIGTDFCSVPDYPPITEQVFMNNAFV